MSNVEDFQGSYSFRRKRVGKVGEDVNTMPLVLRSVGKLEE